LSASTTATPSSATATPSSQSAQQAAASLAGFLAQSATDRSSAVNAVNSVSQCGPTLSKDPQILETAAAARQPLLSQLASLPGRSALPGQMLQVLTSAWQASATADRDFAQWAQDELSEGCTQKDRADPNFQAAAAPDAQATTDKKALVNLWNPDCRAIRAHLLSLEPAMTPGRLAGRRLPASPDSSPGRLASRPRTDRPDLHGRIDECPRASTRAERRFVHSTPPSKVACPGYRHLQITLRVGRRGVLFASHPQLP
jgi:hypothetical protein